MREQFCCFEDTSLVSPQLSKSTHAQVVEVYHEDTSRGKMSPDRFEARDLICCCQYILKRVARNDDQPEGFTEFE